MFDNVNGPSAIILAKYDFSLIFYARVVSVIFRKGSHLLE